MVSTASKLRKAWTASEAIIPGLFHNLCLRKRSLLGSYLQVRSLDELE